MEYRPSGKRKIDAATPVRRKRGKDPATTGSAEKLLRRRKTRSHTHRKRVGQKKNLKQGIFTTKTKTSRRRLLENKRQGSRSSE
jgi:hypothetical protein